MCHFGKYLPAHVHRPAWHTRRYRTAGVRRRRTACTRRAGSANSFTSCSWVSTSMIAGHCAVGYFLPCHSPSPAIRAEVSVPTSDVGQHCAAATGVIPAWVLIPQDRPDRFPVLQNPHGRVPDRVRLDRVDLLPDTHPHG